MSLSPRFARRRAWYDRRRMETHLYEKLLSGTRGRLARVLICGVIGGLIAVLVSLKADDPTIHNNWHWFLAGGTAVGMLAGILLSLQDLLRQRRDNSGRSPRSGAFEVLWLVLILLGLCALVMVGGVFWTLHRLRWFEIPLR